jgi:uncharacterized protein YndB with AHSA1/START domain
MTSHDSSTADREIVTTRLLDASRERVWSAWTDPEQIIHWWGPDGFTNTIQQMDVRPGGEWTFIMHGPDGTDYTNRIVYEEVVRPERLVYLHGDPDGPPEQDFRSVVTFEDRGGKTFLTMRAVFATKEQLAYVIKEVGAIEGAKQTINHLAEYLAKS